MTIGICALFAFQCNSGKTVKKEDPVNGGNYNSYFPVKEGNYWKYISAAPREETERFEVKINSLSNTANGIIANLSSFPFLSGVNAESNILIKAGGEIEVNDFLNLSGIIFPEEKYFTAGYTWKFGSLNGYVSESTDTIKTDMGTFKNCMYIILTDGFTFSYEMWFKKDTGIVKWGANRTNPPTLYPKYYIIYDYKLN